MGVKGYLVFVPFENVASMEYGGTPTTPGSVTRPDMVTVATTPGHLAGPFEVHQTVQDTAPLAEALRSALKAGALREQEAIGHLMGACAVSPEDAAGLMAGTPPSETFYLLVCRDCGDGDLVMPFDSPAERGKWAAAHTGATGHDRWFVTESAGRLSRERVAEMMDRNDEALRRHPDGR